MKCAKCYQRETIPGELYCNICLKWYNQKSEKILKAWAIKHNEPVPETDYTKSRAERFEELVGKYRGIVEHAKKTGIIK